MKHPITLRILFFILSQPLFIYSQNLRSFTLNDLFNLENIRYATISPDLRYAAVVVERPIKDQIIYSYRGINYRQDIWLLNLESNAFLKILDGKQDSCGYWNPVWAPDSQKIALLSTKGGDNVRVFVYDLMRQSLSQVHTNGANLMTKTHQGQKGFNDPYLWIDNDHLIISLLPKNKAYNSFSMDYLPLHTIQNDWVNMKYNRSSTAATLDSDSLAIYPNDQEALLLKYEVSSQTYSKIDHGYFRHVIRSPTGRMLLVIRRQGGKVLGDQDLIKSAWHFKHEVGLIDLLTDEKRYQPITQFNAGATSGSQPHFWTSNERFLIIKSADHGYPGYLDRQQAVFHSFHHPYTKAIQNDDGIFLQYQKEWFQFNESTGETTPSEPPRAQPKLIHDHQETVLVHHPAKKLILSKRKTDRGLELWLTKEGKPNLVHTFNPWISQVKLPEKKIITFIDGKGQSQNALLYLPTEEKLNKLVLSCYPGTMIQQRTMHRDERFSDYFLNPLLLTSKGYHVLIPTIATTSSEEFAEYPDFVIPALKAALLSQGIPQDQASILGLSHGGYLVYSMIAQSQAFKSAIAIAGYGNLRSLYGSFDIRYRYTDNPFENVGRLRASESAPGGLMTTPIAHPEKYVKNSPVTYSKNIKTPLLIIQGDKDFISIEQGEEMFTHLYRQGKRVRFLRFWGEGHNISAPKNIQRMWEEIDQWLAQ